MFLGNVHTSISMSHDISNHSTEAEEIVLSVNPLPYKLKDLSSIPSTHIKKDPASKTKKTGFWPLHAHVCTSGYKDTPI